MKSLRADLAAATREERTKPSPSEPGDEARGNSREQVRRADAAVNDFRARVRTVLRSLVVLGGEVAASAADVLIDALSRFVTFV